MLCIDKSMVCGAKLADRFGIIIHILETSVSQTFYILCSLEKL